jgi:hypothetical protein
VFIGENSPDPSTNPGITEETWSNSYSPSQKKIWRIPESTEIPSANQRTQNQSDPPQHL